ncbi:PHP domain-containing protein [Paenibacillus campi]|uniref:PHP domain-containing protein n=1 Tax=Paenibacillus campi TaxID=3106031 RepID=UPI002AFF7470|nr:PHP domain-containing protein [Paenibacillus sp. SGZ-1009]
MNNPNHVQLAFADLHTHTQASDGMNTPAENVKLAAEAGLAALAITDHDTVAGVAEALAAAEQHGIIVVPGVEISTMEDGKDIHIVGYYLDIADTMLLERLEGLRRIRDERNELILEKLRELGLQITIDDVLAQLGRELLPDESIGRPHMADTLVAKGYVSDLREAFDKYLAQGAAAYVAPRSITPIEATEWIIEAGGVPVMAHPGIYGDDDLVVRIFDHSRLAGIEVYHSDHLPEDEQRYLKLAEQRDLIVTGGSDYHGERQGKVFHGPLGGRKVPVAVVQQLREASRVGKN